MSSKQSPKAGSKKLYISLDNGGGVHRLPHSYGTNVHLLRQPAYDYLLAQFSQAKSSQPELGRWLKKFYGHLLHEALPEVLKFSPQKIPTRMSRFHPQAAVIKQPMIDDPRKMVVVDLMRAGIVPAQFCYEELHDFFPAKQIRQDHILLNRAAGKDGRVNDIVVGGHKIGGGIDDALVFIPDPMGATGSTVRRAIETYAAMLKKRERRPRFVALHLVVTPEYLWNLRDLSPWLEIFALRLDRGLSSARVLRAPLGRYWQQERGLNSADYIVPGAGGIGELLNNAEA